jgi:hypothetical protein
MSLPQLRLFVPHHYKECPKSISMSRLADKRIEVTIVWPGEYFQGRIISDLYTFYRFMRYGRTTDVETIYVLPGNMVDMNGTLNHPDITSFYDMKRGHFTTTYNTESTEILLYVNTWNHLMSPDPLRSVLYVDIRDLHTTNETRDEIERRLSLDWPWKSTMSVFAANAPYIDLPGRTPSRINVKTP